MEFDVNQYYTQEVECLYQDELYSVRDNGAVMRHSRGRGRKLDDIWSFGRVGANGYLFLGNHPVHRIVATAFHGCSPGSDYVVDHIDTNRQNNRSDNLRWLTRLENILNNPITVSRILFYCGSIEAFLDNPSFLSRQSDYSWMRRVSPDEAKNALNNLLKMANFSKGSYSEWINEKKKQLSGIPKSLRNEIASIHIESLLPDDGLGDSFCYDVLEQGNTKNDGISASANNIIQIGWKYPYCFDCFPNHPNTTLDEYIIALEQGRLFTHRRFGDYVIKRVIFNQSLKTAFVVNLVDLKEKTHTEIWNMTAIYVRDCWFIHENLSFFFNKEAIDKATELVSTFNRNEWIFEPIIETDGTAEECDDSNYESIRNAWEAAILPYQNKHRLFNALSTDVHLSNKGIIIAVESEMQKEWIETNCLSELKEQLSKKSLAISVVLRQRKL